MTFELACMTFLSSILQLTCLTFEHDLWTYGTFHILVRPLHLLVWHLYKQPMNLWTSVWPLNLYVWRSSGNHCTPYWGWTDCMTSIYVTSELICLTSELICLTFLWKSSYSRLRLDRLYNIYICDLWTYLFDLWTYMFGVPLEVFVLQVEAGQIVWHLYMWPMNLPVWPLNLRVWHSSGSLRTPDWG